MVVHRTTTPQDQTPQAHRYSTQKLMQACGLAIWPPIICLNTVGTPTLPLDLDAILIANVNPKQRPALPFLKHGTEKGSTQGTNHETNSSGRTTSRINM